MPEDATSEIALRDRSGPNASGAPGEEGWLIRPLSPEEREWIRSHYPDAKRDVRFLSLMVLGMLLSGALAAAVAFALADRDRWWIAAVGGVAGLALGGVAVWGLNPKGFDRAWRPRQMRPPRRAWVFPTQVFHWSEQDRDGTVHREVRCRVEGGVERVLPGGPQFAWFPEEPAQAEMISTRTRRLYRICYPTHTVEVYPELRLLPAAGESALPEALHAVADARGGTVERHGDSHRRRRRSHRHGNRTHQQRLREKQIRSLVWFLVVCLVGGGLVAGAITMQNRVRTSLSEAVEPNDPVAMQE